MGIVTSDSELASTSTLSSARLSCSPDSLAGRAEEAMVMDQDDECCFSAGLAMSLQGRAREAFCVVL